MAVAPKVPSTGLTPTPSSPAGGAASGGLDEAEVLHRRAQFGFNEIVERPVHPLVRFLGYFWGPIPWMIEVALVLATLLQHWSDLAVIAVLLVVNAGVGFWEEFQADTAIAALRSRLALAARVFRSGHWSQIPARELVPGDRVRIRIGDIVPADVRLGAGGSLDIDQSALTGESLPVSRGANEEVYSGSVVKRGETDGEVVSIGAQTYFGRTARLVASARTVSHFQRAILRIGDYLIAVALTLAIVIELVALARGEDLLNTLQFALVLTIAAIPVAMPTVLSVTMAVGARQLARHQAVVSRLASVEELAGMDVLCADKTGTLTQNRLSVGEPFLVGADSAEEILGVAALASRAEDHDPIDDAVLASPGAKARSGGATVLSFVPFDPVRKYAESVVRGPDGSSRRCAKGAPQVILGLCAPPEAVARDAARVIDEFASRGFRTLAVADGPVGGPWRFLGLLPLSDPVRPDSREVIAALHAQGVGVKMVTGDQRAIGRETARELGLGANLVVPTIAPGGAVELTPAEVEAADGFAQVFPEHKYRIVEALQQRGHIVGMTGDGVNDAPALKKADVGIAVSGATDAARSAASVVLLTPGLTIVQHAVEESRRIFRRMTAYAIYRIEETLRILLFITLSVVVLGFFPVSALMIVLLALLNDGAILAIAYDRAAVSPRPDRWRMRRVLGVASALGTTGVVSSFLLLWLALHVGGIGRGKLQTLIYLKLSVAGHFVIFLTRTEGPVWRSRPSGVLIAAVVGTQLLATVIATSGGLLPSLPLLWVGIIWGYAAVELFADDAVKLLTYRLLDRAPASVAGGRPPGWRRPLFYAARHAGSPRLASGPTPDEGGPPSGNPQASRAVGPFHEAGGRAT